MISLSQQIDEIDRELKMRSEVYPRWVQTGKLRQSIADYQVDRLKAALDARTDDSFVIMARTDAMAVEPEIPHHSAGGDHPRGVQPKRLVHNAVEIGQRFDIARRRRSVAQYLMDFVHGALPCAGQHQQRVDRLVGAARAERMPGHALRRRKRRT